MPGNGLASGYRDAVPGSPNECRAQTHRDAALTRDGEVFGAIGFERVGVKGVAVDLDTQDPIDDEVDRTAALHTDLRLHVVPVGDEANPADALEEALRLCIRPGDDAAGVGRQGARDLVERGRCEVG